MTAQGPRRPGRRAGETRTREAILDAARRSFAAHGYDGATIRGIAAGAGVNPALVHYFYGTKEGLFAAAMQLPVLPSEILARAFGAARDRLGEDFRAHVGEIMVATMLRAWETAEVRTAFLGLLRTAATTDQGLVMLREFVTSAILASLVRAAGLADDADGRYRAALGGQPGRRPGLHQVPAPARADRLGEHRGPGGRGRPCRPALPHRRPHRRPHQVTW